MEILIVGAGGLLGSLTRFVLGRSISKKVTNGFPFATFIINITGAVLLGLVSSTVHAKDMHLFLADGFLGAYTTFSTFMYEGFNLYSGKETLNAAVYIIGSLILGVLGYIIGYGFGNFM